jgi:mannose-6-phosphate isomerase-like protein (cupin superfamily)
VNSPDPVFRVDPATMPDAEPGIRDEVWHGDGCTVLRVAFAAGTELAAHEHADEQLTHVVSGRLTVTFETSDETHVFDVAAGGKIIIIASSQRRPPLPSWKTPRVERVSNGAHCQVT